jgi:hypothetical protein
LIIVVKRVKRYLGRTVARFGKFDKDVKANLADREHVARSEIARVEAQLAEIDAVEALLQMLNAKRDTTEYDSYRGMLSVVHEDLRQLDDALRRARDQWQEAGSSGEPPLERIVLYIDDLDRCTPRQVVDVLAAAHLLLALPLFVVVVAADPRWLITSLRIHHSEMFDDEAVTPTDYLDKIFQVPFTIRPMGDAGVAYLRDLLPSPESAASTPQAPSESTPSPAPNGETAPSFDIREGDVFQEHPKLKRQQLTLSAEEREFLPQLGALLPTPRSAKRFVNLYRLIRIGLTDDDLVHFVNAPYQVVAVLLTFVIVAPRLAREVLPAINAATDPNGDLVDLLDTLPDGQSLSLLVKQASLASMKIGECKPWIRTVARFSFHTYELI